MLAPSPVVLLALVALAGIASAEAAELPSFLFLLGDDIGWADMGYSGGTAHTPNIDKWAKARGSIMMHDFHSGGTVCSPTRASILTGRTPFRDCVFGVYGCSDMTECTPNFPFAPKRTFTIGDAARLASPDYFSMHFGKWHLGSFYNDSKDSGGVNSSPVFHGFDDFNSTVEVAPTATTNCQCRAEWESQCLLGHYHKPTHCSHNQSGHVLNPNPTGAPGCCFNYWWRNDSAPHAVSNLSTFVPQDDSAYLADSFIRFLDRRAAVKKPFVAQVSFHNCHIPFIGTAERIKECTEGKVCDTVQVPGQDPVGRNNYSDSQLDFYACLSELDSSVGEIIAALDRTGYRDNTMIWFSTDNGPEVDCPPEGICAPDHFLTGPGSAGPLRGRKRDIWEGGHRVPGIMAWPAVVKSGPNTESWHTVISSDFLPTILEVLQVQRPSFQAAWPLDGISQLSFLKGEKPSPRCIGHLYAGGSNKGFRCGKWKLVNGTKSCPSNADCHSGPMLYDLEEDLGERNDLAKQKPEVLASMIKNLTTWYNSVLHSIEHESQCPNAPSGGGSGNGIPIPGPYPSSQGCTWYGNTALDGGEHWTANTTTAAECCGICRATPGCKAAHFSNSPPDPMDEFTNTFGVAAMATVTNTCNLRSVVMKKPGHGSVCVPK